MFDADFVLRDSEVRLKELEAFVAAEQTPGMRNAEIDKSYFANAYSDLCRIIQKKPQSSQRSVEN